jgi:hypothetical protein
MGLEFAVRPEDAGDRPHRVGRDLVEAADEFVREQLECLDLSGAPVAERAARDGVEPADDPLANPPAGVGEADLDRSRVISVRRSLDEPRALQPIDDTAPGRGSAGPSLRRGLHFEAGSSQPPKAFPGTLAPRLDSNARTRTARDRGAAAARGPDRVTGRHDMALPWAPTSGSELAGAPPGGGRQSPTRKEPSPWESSPGSSSAPSPGSSPT